METLLRVLIVDNQALQPNLEHLLQENAFIELLRAANLRAAVAELRNYRFDCVLLDSTLVVSNKSNSYLEARSLSELLLELRSLTQTIPVIVVADREFVDTAEHQSSAAKHQNRSQWSEFGWQVLERSTLTPALLSHAVEWVARVCKAEQQANSTARRLRQTDQLLVQQTQTIEAQAQQIQQLNAQLVEAAQLKEQFLAMVSHELRTPMNAIIGFSQLLERDRQGLMPRQADMVERILVNAKQLLSTIDQMLIFSKIEAGQLTLQPKSFNLAHLIRAITEELEPMAAKKHLELNLRLHLEDPVITTDPSYLQQVLLNLISNAIKFTPTGTITVEATASEQQITIAVRDTGIGIEPDELEHIFEPFRQIDQSLTRSYRGVGLGLALTAALVQQMQGKIAVRSQIDEGSVFWVDLPRQINTVGKTPSVLLGSTAPAGRKL